MRKFNQIMFKIQAFLLAIFLGSWLGARIRPLVGAPPSQGGAFHMEDDQGHTYQSIPVITHMLPGLMLAALAKPRWLMAFLGSFTASLLLGDEVERRLLLAFGEKVIGSLKNTPE
jgi:hypothetical protein